MKELFKKIQAVREAVKVGKDGRNDFGKYNYFTPDNVIRTVNTALKASGLIAFFSMKWNADIEMYEARLYVHELDKPEIFKEFAFDICKGIVKGANESQASGSTLTYGKRYSYMNAFDIVDNRDDLDSNEIHEKGTKAEKKEEKLDVRTAVENSKNVDELGKIFKGLKPAEQKEYKQLFTDRKAVLENGK